MLIVSTIFLLLIVPLAMALFRLVRPKFGIQGFMVVLTVIAGWILVMLARSDSPQTITLLNWQPETFFPNSPSLMIDQISWSFALALISLTAGVTFTSIAQLGQSMKVLPPSSNPIISVDETQNSSTPESGIPVPSPQPETGLSASWRAWAGILVLTSVGLVAVSAGNMLTLLIGWAAVDLIELVIQLSQVLESKPRERIVVAFSARMAGTAMALLAGIIPWSQGIPLSFDAINQSTSIYLILAAGLRLGVLPIHQPALQEIPLRRGLGTILRLVPAASSFILLVRVAQVGVLGPATPYLLGLTALAGLYAGMHWINASNELEGRSYWLVGTSTLAVASAILNHPGACIAWSTASILGGGLLFSMSIRHKNILPFVVIGVLSFAGLPFSPTWRGMNLYEYIPVISTSITRPVFYVLVFFYLLIHCSLLIGYTRHILRGIYLPERNTHEHVERWVWLLYPIALSFILVTNLLIGMLNQPRLADVSATSWGMGAATIGISIVIGYFLTRTLGMPLANELTRQASVGTAAISLSWVYRLLWRIFRLVTRVSGVVSNILEGDGGILWALVLFALIFVFLQR